MSNELIILGNTGIRRRFHNGEYWFAVVDVIEVLTESNDPSQTWRDMKRRDKEIVEFCHKLKIPSKKDGKNYAIDCANQRGILRIVQSVPSSKAEPFKRWLAATGDRRLDEIKNDSIEAMRERLRFSGMNEVSIGHRIEALIKARELKGEWTNRKIRLDDQEIFADEIHQGTFEGMSRADHADLKRLEDGEFLRDHMSDIEIAFDILGSATALDDIEHGDPKTFEENLNTAQKAGKTAGKLREVWEEEKGRKVITDRSAIDGAKRLTKGRNSE